MFADAIAKVTGSVFPIFFDASEPGISPAWGIAGTGFFVSEDGLFVTALHVFSNAPKGAKMLYAGNVPDNWFQPQESILEVARDKQHDLFLGRIVSGFLTGVTLAQNIPRVGTSVCLCGYPVAGTKIHLGTDGLVYFHEVAKYWQPTFVVDLFRSEPGKPIDGFVTQHPSLRGMSGGPVFDTFGIVCGLSFQSWGRKEHDESPPVVENAAVVGVDHLRTLIESATTT